MGEFTACLYRITRAGRHVAGGVFGTADEIFDRIRCHRPGVYSVYRQPPPGQESGPDAAFWGDVVHFGAGRISFDPGPARD